MSNEIDMNLYIPLQYPRMLYKPTGEGGHIERVVGGVDEEKEALEEGFVKAEDRALTPAEDADGDGVPDDIQGMDKDALCTWANGMFGLNLDKRQSLKALRDIVTKRIKGGF